MATATVFTLVNSQLSRISFPIEFPQRQSSGVIAKEHEGPPPCSGRLWRRPRPDCCRSDARLGRTRTSPTSYAWRASSRTGHGAPTFRGGVLQGLRRRGTLLSPTRDQGAALSPPAATTRSHPDHQKKQT